MKYTVAFPEGDGTWFCFDCATRAEAEEEAEHFSCLFVGWSIGLPEPDEYEGEAELLVKMGRSCLSIGSTGTAWRSTTSVTRKMKIIP